MKEIILEKKGTYEEIVEFINKEYVIEEPTVFIFKKVIETNAKMRKCTKFKGIYSYEVDGFIKLYDENHKKNLYNKMCIPVIGGGYSPEYFAKMGID